MWHLNAFDLFRPWILTSQSFPRCSFEFVHIAPPLHSDLPLCDKHRRILSHMLFPDEFNQLKPISLVFAMSENIHQTNIQNGYRLELWAFFIANDAFPSTCHNSFSHPSDSDQGGPRTAETPCPGIFIELVQGAFDIGTSGFFYDKTLRMPENRFCWSKSCRDMEEFNGDLLMTDGFLIRTGIDWDWIVSGFLSPA